MIAVSDTGEGMSAETRASVFEPFFTTKGIGKGTGLGLATVRGIVAQSGGHVWVCSEVGVGSTFRIHLPIVDEPPSAVPSALRAPSRVGGDETLLVVDDDEAVRRLVVTVLRANGYAVLDAPHPAAALTLCAERNAPIDLVVTDVVMPGMNGRELIEQLRLGQPGLRVLFTSGYNADAAVRRGVIASEVEYLTKPFTPQALLESVRRVLDSK
jgi:CheY-like chemotaxis protein